MQKAGEVEDDRDWAARIVGVTKCYGSVRAVNNVSFAVRNGELLTLLGPSGCGKTTIMRSIAGLERITDGEIYFGDRIVSSVPRRTHVLPEKRNVGMVFQSYAIWPHMTVFENVAYPLRCRRLRKDEINARVRKGLQLVEMEQLEERRATQLSGGQQQRVALARSIVMEPSILLLDEPLSNLDAKLRAQMRVHIKELQRRTGLTMIYVTHDQIEAMALSDRIIVMNSGVIEQVGTPEEIYENPQSEFVADFVGAINLVPAVVEALGPAGAPISVRAGHIGLTCLPLKEANLGVGANVLLMIRPEKLEVHRRDGRSPGASRSNDSDNRFTGVVTSNTYCGDHREIVVICGEVPIRVVAPSLIDVEVGTAVDLWFATKDLHLVPRSGAAGVPDTVASTGDQLAGATVC